MFDFFSGKTTLLQRKMIEDWLKQEGNEDIYYDYLLKWEKENLQYSSDDSTTPQWVTAVFDEAYSPKSPELFTAPQPAWKRMLVSWKVAASVLLVLAASAVFFGQDFLLYQTYQTHYAEIETIQLPDGTSVILNMNSQLKVPRYIGRDGAREVWLSGEAFFKVARKQNRQRFIVHTPLVAVEVLGTRFNVSNRHGRSEVILEEGKVKLNAAMHKNMLPLVMRPGEYVAVSPNDTIFQKKIVKVHQYTAWQHKKLIFEDKPLSEVAQTIEDYYGISVRIKNRSLAHRKFTGTLPANDLEVVLESLSTMYQLEIEKEKNLIILR